MTLLRPATAADLPALTAIVDAAYGPYIPRIGRKPGPMSDDYTALVAQGLVQVLEDQGRVCGLLVLIAQLDALLLDNIAIAPEAQGRGFGRLLLAAAENAARAAGLPVIRLYTNVAMTENIAIYSRQGYAETGRRVENGLHRVYMEKRL
ncbi:MAG TPA: GNAT family N-acetyltransferase [Gemmobacter sp.]|nr:GNAT family N-acetyltransferase [Gemmobacter sp.]HBU14395.1 GNAT family N-acetyltransferase [Gemmobacter sp.]